MFLDSNDFEKWMRRIDEHLNRIEKKLEKPDQPERIRLTVNGNTLYDNQDLCMMFNVSKRTLQRYRTLGWLPYRKIDQKTYYMESDVREFIDTHMKNLRNLKEKNGNIEINP